MSTRAIFTFIDHEDYTYLGKPLPSRDTFHVYKAHDGYPAGAFKAIKNSLRLAWELPRFEADEFAAAFVSSNKIARGEMRLTNYHDTSDFPEAIEYHYEITFKDAVLFIKAFEIRFDSDKNSFFELIFEGSLEEFGKFILTYRSA
jgi:hypothetical protein